MRLIAATALSLLLGTASIAQDVPVFRMTLPSPLIMTDGGTGAPPGGGVNNPLLIETTIPAASRMPLSITVPVEITGMEQTDRIEVDGTGFTWTPGAHGMGTLLWTSPAVGTHIATVRVVEADGALRDSRAVEVRVHPQLSATVPETGYTAEVGDMLTITPNVSGLIGVGQESVRWGASYLPRSWGFDEISGKITVDTSAVSPTRDIVLTAVDQVDMQDASTQPFSVAVNGSCGTWTAQAAPEQNTWYSVTYGNGRFVAVAFDGVNRIMTSSDGLVWTARPAPEQNKWQAVTYGNGRFVAVATNGAHRIMTSPDGISWTVGSHPAGPNGWYSVTYGNGRFVAVAPTGSGNQVITSPDGVNWTVQTAPEPSAWYHVGYLGGQFIALATSGTNRIMTSPDGITWTLRAIPTSWASAAYGNGRFVAVTTTGTDRVMTSPDGITWTPQEAPRQSWASVTYDGSKFIAVATNGANRVMTSPDGVIWTLASASEPSSWLSIAYGGGRHVAVAFDGTNRIMTSDC